MPPLRLPDPPPVLLSHSRRQGKEGGLAERATDALRGRRHSNAHFADVDAGMLTGGHHTPLPWSENTFTAAW